MEEHAAHKKKLFTLGCLEYLLLLCLSEVFLHLFLFSLGGSLLYPVLFALVLGGVIMLLGLLPPPVLGAILLFVSLLANLLLALLYLGFYGAWRTCFDLSVLSGGVSALARGVLSGLRGLFPQWLLYPALFIPLTACLVILFLANREWLTFPVRKQLLRRIWPVPLLSAAVLAALLFFSTGDIYSPGNLLRNRAPQSLWLQKLGWEAAFGKNAAERLLPGLSGLAGDSAMPGEDAEYIEGLIDFSALPEEDGAIGWLNANLGTAGVAAPNKYVGMFSGYNLVTVVAESFSPLAIDPDMTPTLYKLSRSGFLLENFYTTGYNCEGDGEYMLLTGLLPERECSRSLEKSAGTDTALAPGRVLGARGYRCCAYSALPPGTGGRDQALSNMGYTYSCPETPGQTPPSDLELVRLTVNEYLGDDLFHVVYFTASGTPPYGFESNGMSAKHRASVAELNLSETMRAYVAANMELDRAVEYLINALYRAGVLDRTLICIVPNRQPLSLAEEISARTGRENMSWYEGEKSAMLLWNSAMTNSVTVKKVCSAVDVLPTLYDLLGVRFDSRLLAGRSTLGYGPGLVCFANGSFMTDQFTYDSVRCEMRRKPGAESAPEGKNVLSPEQAMALARGRQEMSRQVLRTDYYAYLRENRAMLPS
ncbi:MAG: sulfatase-like hydrolase/transferase [Oscillospiraceae bacterium]|nr:sulfatase-like hydrolase/transferase [Oscillospiraceae bacterium]